MLYGLCDYVIMCYVLWIIVYKYKFRSLIWFYYYLIIYVSKYG